METAQEVLDCPLLSLQRFVYGEIGLFFFLLFQLPEGVGWGGNPLWLLHDLPTSHLSDLTLPLFPIPTPPCAHWPPGWFWKVPGSLVPLGLCTCLTHSSPYRHMMCFLNFFPVPAQIFLIMEVVLLLVIPVPIFPGTFSFMVL